MVNQYLLEKLNESPETLATVAAFLKVTYYQTGNAFKSHLSCVYRKMGVELPSIINSEIFKIMKRVDVCDAVETIVHYLRNNYLEDTAKVIQLFVPYDKTLSREDVLGLQVELPTGNQDTEPEDPPSPLPSISGTAESQDVFQDTELEDPHSHTAWFRNFLNDICGDPTDKTLSREDVPELQVELPTGNQDTEPEDPHSPLLSTHRTSACFRDILSEFF